MLHNIKRKETAPVPRSRLVLRQLQALAVPRLHLFVSQFVSWIARTLYDARWYRSMGYPNTPHYPLVAYFGGPHELGRSE